MTNEVAHSIILNNTSGRHNKTYRIQLVPQDGGWVVNTQHGAIGSALRPGTKTPLPVPYDKARKAYNSLVKSKIEKSGYTPEVGTGEAVASTATSTPITRERVDVPVMLLNAISPAEGELLLADPAWGMEIKQDGERRLIVIEGGDAYGVNRTGFKVALSPAVRAAALASPMRGRTVLDGEDMGDHVAVFDVLMLDGQDTTGLPLRQRINYRSAARARLPGFRYASTATTTQTKADMLALARKAQLEGVVLKCLDSVYSDGRPNSGGDALKWKFVESASCRVASVHPIKRSVGLELMDPASGVWLGVGNVTIPSNYDIPAAGDIAEVQYLYAHRGGSIYQPVYRGQRNDIDISACHIDQLKFVDDRDLQMAA